MDLQGGLLFLFIFTKTRRVRAEMSGDEARTWTWTWTCERERVNVWRPTGSWEQRVRNNSRVKMAAGVWAETGLFLLLRIPEITVIWINHTSSTLGVPVVTNALWESVHVRQQRCSQILQHESPAPPHLSPQPPKPPCLRPDLKWRDDHWSQISSVDPWPTPPSLPPSASEMVGRWGGRGLRPKAGVSAKKQNKNKRGLDPQLGGQVQLLLMRF